MLSVGRLRWLVPQCSPRHCARHVQLPRPAFPGTQTYKADIQGRHTRQTYMADIQGRHIRQTYKASSRFPRHLPHLLALSSAPLDACPCGACIACPPQPLATLSALPQPLRAHPTCLASPAPRSCAGIVCARARLLPDAMRQGARPHVAAIGPEVPASYVCPVCLRSLASLAVRSGGRLWQGACCRWDKPAWPYTACRWA